VALVLRPRPAPYCGCCDVADGGGAMEKVGKAVWVGG